MKLSSSICGNHSSVNYSNLYTYQEVLSNEQVCWQSSCRTQREKRTWSRIPSDSRGSIIHSGSGCRCTSGVREGCSSWENGWAGENYRVPCSVGWWQRCCSCKPWLSCTVQRRYWTVQRRLTFRSFCKPVYHEVLRLRADIQKQLNNSADGRR